MSDRPRVGRLQDLKFKRIPRNEVSSEAAGSSSSVGPNRRRISRRTPVESDDNDFGPGLRDEATRRLLKRRAPRNPVPPGERVVEKQTRFSSNRVISRNDLINLSVHAEKIAKVLKKKPQPSAADWQIVRGSLYQIPFENVDQKTVHNSGAMRELIKLEDGNFEFDLPEDISLDAQMILKRWRNGDYDPHLLRGIDLNQTVVPGRGGRPAKKRARHYKLEEDYNWKRDDNVEGNHDLFVGEWWPLQICALRDGAHGDMEAGISGNNIIGAISVIVSGGALYPDLDELERVLYCGTMGVEAPINYADDPEEREHGDRIPSPNTKYLLLAFEKATKIRLFRSSKSPSPYAPAEGLRYDGLYTIRAYEILDKKNAVYRFEMIREPNQAAIRGDPEDPGCKPNRVELAQWHNIKKTLKGER
ncbi:hypothetical protein L873DRAFT_1691616 [Choiromyces venosus 120613-1]|uniref:YDG domain-containing protein n=1 Tax=Choiromyces venosus 120613-1 TaxID=1336337 RepID=A0A3N4JG61_9PEZI|nr:hypothetical protein L873DRAFT_1691616 [Choiromyces venosus 120613-1]